MRIVTLLLFAELSMLSVAPAQAQSANVRCVQQYLRDEGYPISVVDGLFGPNTAAAGQQFLAAEDMDLPPLDRASAKQWCDTLVPPSFELVIDEGVEESFAATIADGLRAAEAFMTAQFNEKPDETVVGFISPESFYLKKMYLETVGKLNDFDASCNPNAVYGWYSIYFCTATDIWDRGPTFTMETAAHEYWHVFQAQWTGEALARPCCNTNTGITAFGPEWLKEGSAQYIAHLIARGSPATELHHRAVDARQGGKISDYTSRGGLRSNINAANAAGFIGTHLLVEQSGFGSLRTFYQNISKGMNHEEAFAGAFGRTVEQFDEEFSAYLATL